MDYIPFSLFALRVVYEKWDEKGMKHLVINKSELLFVFPVLYNIYMCGHKRISFNYLLFEIIHKNIIKFQLKT